MFGKILSGLVMGLIAAVLGSVLLGLLVGGGPEGVTAGFWGMGLGFALVLTLAVTAKRAKRAWGRGFLVCALMSFALPLAGLVFSGIVGTKVIEQADPETGARAGAAIGAGLGGMMVTGTLAFMGFFAGLIFAILAFFLLRNDSTRRNENSAS